MSANHPVPGLLIRQAIQDDCPLILDFIRELAEYEKLSDKVVATVDDLAEHLFGDVPRASVLIAEIANQAAGFALYFHNFSTFLGQPGIYLEDLFVRPTHRGQGIGRALLGKLAQRAIEMNCGRIEWAVLDWNQPAIDFYRSLGAIPLDEWIVNRITGDNLARLADNSS